MTKPGGVRFALASDAEALMVLVRISESEWSLGARNYDKVRGVIAASFSTDPMLDVDGISLKPRFAVVPGEGIEAACGIYPERRWDSDEPLLRGFWHYVHPKYRESTHAKSLYQFGNWFADRAGLPLIWELFYPESQEVAEKERLAARQAERIGGLFLHMPMVAKAAA